eukprot:433238_1
MPGIVAPPGYPDELRKYATMLKVGIPIAAVKGKMFSDGFDDDMFDKYLNPDTAITLNQEDDDDNDSSDSSNDGENENGDEKKEEYDPLDPNQAEPADQPPPQSQPQQQSAPSGFFTNSNFVPPADSELKMDTLQPVPVKKTLLIVNTFVVNTAAFLNKFVTTCESKLRKIHSDVQRMETTLQLLETKLASIDWLRQAEQGQAPVIPNIESWDMEEKKQSNDQQPTANTNNNNADNTNAADDAPPAEPEKPTEDPLLSDETMIPWFKMLRVGVPAPAVRNKMYASGVDDATIERVIELHNSR